MIVGFDYNRAHLDLASKRAHEEGRKNVSFQMANAEEPWPYKSSSFDCVLALDILEHLDRRRAFLGECLRVLKPDGRLLLAVPNRETSWKQLQKRVGLSYFSDPDHKVEYSRGELEQELTDSRFRIVSLTPVVYDTRWYGFIDLMGGVSKSVYDRLAKWKRRVAMERPEESNGFRVVAHSVRNR
jgi:2-polyprenyl-3-methyl-5-hydroxy-6-metoxy-1,4-benzoquinol methylase